MDCIKNMDVKITILQVEVANLRPNPWNTNSVGAQNFEKLKGSIEKLGFFKPILARELDGGIFEILGGEHRWRAAMEQGISTVPVMSVGKINDLVAKQMSLVDSQNPHYPCSARKRRFCFWVVSDGSRSRFVGCIGGNDACFSTSRFVTDDGRYSANHISASH